MHKATIRLSKKDDPTDIFDLEYDLLDTPFLSKWIGRFCHAAERGDTISEPWALYNLNDDWNEAALIEFMNDWIDQCNHLHSEMIDRHLTSVDDRDTLNYLHSVFEQHHGKLDEWKSNPILANEPMLRDCLSVINQTVHRIESYGNAGYIRVVCFDLPKTETFTEDDYALFTDTMEFGGLYTLYADVGKNLESLATDHDDHHHDFVPNLHYSVDCTACFYNSESRKIHYDEFLDHHWEYFASKGYSRNDPRLTTGRIKLGQLVYDDKDAVLNSIRKFNRIQRFSLYDDTCCSLQARNI